MDADAAERESYLQGAIVGGEIWSEAEAEIWEKVTDEK